ncbi:MAG: hypothetical protein AB7U82_26580 [Blastocatellales bacterium]
MKTAFPIYEKWGIEGVMVDFFERDDQGRSTSSANSSRSPRSIN